MRGLPTPPGLSAVRRHVGEDEDRPFGFESDFGERVRRFGPRLILLFPLGERGGDHVSMVDAHLAAH